MHKKGFSTLMLIAFAFIVFIVVVVIGVGLYTLNLFDSTIRTLDFTIGNQSFLTIYNETLGQGIQDLTDQGDNFGVMLIFGMIITMFLVAWLTGEDKHRLWIVLDIAIIIIAFALAIYIKVQYTDFVNENIIPIEIYADDLSNTSRLVTILPNIIPVIGIIIMIITYLVRREKTLEEKYAEQYGIQ